MHIWLLKVYSLLLSASLTEIIPAQESWPKLYIQWQRLTFGEIQLFLSKPDTEEDKPEM